MEVNRLNLLRAILYGATITIVTVLPRSPAGEMTCQDSVFLAPIYIGEEVGVFAREDNPIAVEQLCDRYFGFPIVYIADLYDVKPAYVSFTRLILNWLIVTVVLEFIIYAASSFSKRYRPSEY